MAAKTGSGRAVRNGNASGLEVIVLDCGPLALPCLSCAIAFGREAAENF